MRTKSYTGVQILADQRVVDLQAVIHYRLCQDPPPPAGDAYLTFMFWLPHHLAPEDFDLLFEVQDNLGPEKTYAWLCEILTSSHRRGAA